MGVCVLRVGWRFFAFLAVFRVSIAVGRRKHTGSRAFLEGLIVAEPGPSTPHPLHVWRVFFFFQSRACSEGSRWPVC